MGCRKHSPGNPCDCIPPDCEFVEADLPTVTIDGMTEATGWLFFNSGECCIASKRFTFDSPQTEIVIDGGDVLTWDKTEVCETERFSIDKTCGTAVQALWVDNETGTGLGVVDIPEQPAYDCCDPITITQVHTLTKTARKRGGRRFVVTVAPSAIWVSFQKTSAYVCSPAAAVTRWIMRSYVYYDGNYSYIDYGEETTAYTSTANTTCWEWPANTSIGTYPWDIDSVDNVTSFTNSLETGIICRQKVLTTIPTVETSYTFLDGDIPDSGCTEPCDMCDASELCFSSDPDGDDEPSDGFCEATIISEDTDAAYLLQLCTDHLVYWWSNPIDALTCLTLFDGMFSIPPIVMQDAVICCDSYAPADLCTIPAYNYPTLTTLTAGGPESGIIEYCDYTSLKAGQVIEDCWPTQSCPDCPTGSQVGDSDHNLAVAAATQTILKA